MIYNTPYSRIETTREANRQPGAALGAAIAVENARNLKPYTCEAQRGARVGKMLKGLPERSKMQKRYNELTEEKKSLMEELERFTDHADPEYTRIRRKLYRTIKKMQTIRKGGLAA